MKHYSSSKLKDVNNDLVSKQLKSLESKMKNVVDGYEKIKQYSYDPETIASLYYKISRQLIESPDERIAWLENLSRYQEKQNNLEESAQSKILTAAFVQEYLTLIGRWDTV